MSDILGDMAIWFSEFWPSIVYIAKGTPQTVALICGAMGLGLILGLPMAALAVYGPKWSRRLISLYAWYFRGTPVLVLLFMFFFGIFGFIELMFKDIFGLDIRVSPFYASIVVLGLCSGAYQSQIFRGAILSLPAGQFRAALALGMTPVKAVRHIIIPQAFRIAIPAWANEYSILLKDSAVAFSLGTMEIMSRAQSVAATSYKPLPAYLTAGVLYLILTWAGVALLKKMERGIRIPGLAHEVSGSNP